VMRMDGPGGPYLVEVWSDIRAQAFSRAEIRRSMRLVSQAAGLLDGAVQCDGDERMRFLQAAAEAREIGAADLELPALAEAIGERLLLDEDELREVRLVALVHEAGRSHIPGALHDKVEPLTPVEWAVVQRHTLIGQRMLSRMPYLRPAVAGVGAIREHWDGNGYPHGFAGEEIPLSSRIVAVCAAYRAIRRGRPGRLAGAGRGGVRGCLHRGPALRRRPLRGELLRRHLDAGTPGTLGGMGTRVIAVVGATATGKSGLATELALALGGEVVNADSMQLYQGMDIGTAKEPEAARRGVPHHLLDIWPVTQTANVAEYAKLARTAIDEIIARGRVPVLAGGSGLYVRAALDDLDFPGTDEAIRASLEEELARVGAAALHARLARLDPAAAAAILPGNGRRIVRALEVIEISGRPFAATMPAFTENRPAVQIGLTLPRPELDQRIGARVDRMWEAGLEAEVRGLAAQGLRDGKTASRALGYQQLLRYLDGEWTLDEARLETTKATRRFARRQESWFRRDPRVRWLDASQPADAVATGALGLIRTA